MDIKKLSISVALILLIISLLSVSPAAAMELTLGLRIKGNQRNEKNVVTRKIELRILALSADKTKATVRYEWGPYLGPPVIGRQPAEAGWDEYDCDVVGAAGGVRTLIIRAKRDGSRSEFYFDPSDHATVTGRRIDTMGKVFPMELYPL
jgi:hypothetical protein